MFYLKYLNITFNQNKYLIINKIKELVRFSIVGVLATAIHYGIYLFLMQWILVNWAYTIGYIISFILNFFLSAHFTFKSNASVKKGIGFGISHLINYSLQILFLNFFKRVTVSVNLSSLRLSKVSLLS